MVIGCATSWPKSNLDSKYPVTVGGFGVRPYMGEASCLPSGERDHYGYHSHHGYQAIQNSTVREKTMATTGVVPVVPADEPQQLGGKPSLDSIWTPVMLFWRGSRL